MSKRLSTPENWPRFNDLNENSMREEKIDQSSASLPGLQQPAARMTQGWDFNRTVELNIESDGKFKFEFKGPYSALLGTYSSLAMMKNCFSPTRIDSGGNDSCG